TLTPVLCSYFLKIKDQKENDDTKLVSFLKKFDRKILNRALDYPFLVLGITSIALVGSVSLIPFMGRDFLPKFNEGTAMISLAAPPGISLTESNKFGEQAERIIMQTPEVKSVSRRTGRAELDEHAMGVNVSEIDVDFKPSYREKEVVLNEIRDRLTEKFPQLGIAVGQPLSHLIDHMLSGVSAALAIKIFGSDLQTLREKAIEVQAAIDGTPGLVDLRVEQQGLIPQLKIQVLRDDAAKYGLSAGEITSLLEAALNGEIVTQVIEENKFFDVFYRFDDQSRSSLERIQKTVLKVMPTGQKVLLEQVADVYEASGPNEVFRENGQRRIVISGNVSERDLAGLVGEIQNRIQQKVKLPEDYYVTFGGQFESQQRATQKILLFGILAILGIALILLSHFHSKMIVAQIMLTIPFAFIGGIILLFFTDRTITVASLVGFITLCGVASRNGIMMISHYLHLMEFEGESFTKEMIIRGSVERLVPVMMTASVTTRALLPLVWATGQPGSEILHPVAVVIVGGLLSSTLLDIVVTPTLFYKFVKEEALEYIDKKNHRDKI
ncbi:MAG: efflux RND transporter permease subunit, partial [Pseudobdellovibrionaceae bacterium]